MPARFGRAFGSAAVSALLIRFLRMPGSVRLNGSRQSHLKGRNFMRSSGILLHITSLPSPGGIGDLGPEAYAFADFLVSAGMKIWQVLPIGPTGYGESPYQSPSAFAGNPLLISLSRLRDEGLLTYDDSEIFVPADPERADYAGAWKAKDQTLSCDRFCKVNVIY